MFPTAYNEIIALIDQIDPVKYGSSRNYINGAVTKLSPYISRGVLTTRQVAKAILAKGYKPYQIESFLKELAWRDYFQQVWIALGEGINKDVKQSQSNVANYELPTAIANAATGITAIDDGIAALYETGYMHNHMRMYVASIACNIAQSHWLQPAQWMYYHLLDADWASNALSWQWVAGSFSSKKYFANQQNINKYCFTNQTGTFLDREYEDFSTMPIPNALQEKVLPALKTNLPNTSSLHINEALPIYVYNFYNLDASWGKDIDANRILLLEPSFFKQYPVCDSTISFILDLAKNIDNIQIAVAEFDEVFSINLHHQIHFKEHPANRHYQGNMHQREWMFEEVKGYFPSFFSFWKKGEKCLQHLY